MDIRVLFEDKHIIVCEKPVGVLSQAGDGTTDAPDMVSLLMEREREHGNQDAYIGVVHRLDHGVGGAIVYAKKPYAAAELSEAFRQRMARKEYLCTVWGEPRTESETLTHLLWKDARQNKVYCVERKRAGVREATLDYRVLGRGMLDGKPCALLSVTLGTGRSHQIRAQLSQIGLPIVGDGKYGGHRCEELVGIALWSHKLTFPHPVTLSRAKDGRKPNPKAPVFADVDVCSYPPLDMLPWSLFRSVTELGNALDKTEN